MKNILIITFLICAFNLYNPSVAYVVKPSLTSNSSGQKIYTSKCIACHNKDPRLSGSVGPDLYGTTLELLTLKTQKKEYPKGYTPKRKTKIMPKIPLNDTQLNDLYQYINSFKK